MTDLSKTAWVCAGQGAQYVGMGRDLADAVPACRALFDQAKAVLGFDLARLCFEGPEPELVKSNIAQPAIFAVTAVCAAALRARLPDTFPGPLGLAGLSLGEWTALHLAGAVKYDDCLRILEARGKFMQEACDAQAGGMLSVIGLDVERVGEIAAAAGVEVANYNSPGQTVLSGRSAALPAAEKMAKDAGAKRVVPLSVAGAYHSSLMQPAAEKLARLLESVPLQAPAVPVMSNVTGRAHGAPDEIRRLMVRQVTSPVNWIACVQSLAQAGAQQFVECGPGRVLSGLIKRIMPGTALSNVQDAPSLDRAAAEMAG